MTTSTSTDPDALFEGLGEARSAPITSSCRSS